MSRVLHALGIVVLVCVSVRILAAIVAPVLPTLVSLFVLIALVYWLLSSVGVRKG